MYMDTNFPPPDGRLAQLMRVLDSFDADTIGAAVDAMIERLDHRDGDPDLEPNGDERDAGVVDWHHRDPAYRAELRGAALALAEEDSESDGNDGDHNGSEDCFIEHRFGDHSPGCPIADPGEPVGDEKDASFTEWCEVHSGAVTFANGNPSALGLEDAEDDDSDRCAAGDDHMIAGGVAGLEHWDPRYDGRAVRIGDDADAEEDAPPAYQIDQRRPLFVTAANNPAEWAA